MHKFTRIAGIPFLSLIAASAFCLPALAAGKAGAESPPSLVLAPQAADNSAGLQKALVIELEIPAPVKDVWTAFATSEGLRTWLAPDTTVVLKPGGDWLVHFPGGSTGGGTIVSFAPEKEIVISALAPDQFPHVRAERTHAVFQFEPRGQATVVRLIQTGWKSGDEWDRAYEYLVAGNAQLLSALHRRFVKGPTDWKAAAPSAERKNSEVGQ